MHGDNTTAPVLPREKTVIGQVCMYVPDHRPFAGPDPPAALFFYSHNRNGEHPARHLGGYGGILQADAYAGFVHLDDARRQPGPITEAARWSHARRQLFVRADLVKSPLAGDAVRRVEEIFAMPFTNITGADRRLIERSSQPHPLFTERAPARSARKRAQPTLNRQASR